jgi:hypothetical protein
MKRSTKIRICHQGASMLFYPAALPLSARTLTYVAGVIRRHRRKIGSCWRKLSPGRQADPKQDAARGEEVQRGRVRRDVHRLADTGLDHIGAELQRPCHRGGAAQGRPRGHTRARMITRQQSLKPRGLQAARQRQPRIQVGRLGLYAHCDRSHQSNLLEPQS